MKHTITIGTRGSQLALWQAEYVRKCLNNHFPDRSIELRVIKTTGDRIRDRSLVGLGKGVFTKEIEIALLDSTIDLAVHSMKDLPTDMPDGLCIAAIPVREDPRDVLVTQSGLLLDQLPTGAQIGTTSPRRKSQLLHLRPDLQVVDVRGNLDTRLRKLHETELDGVILAAAGIKRLMGEETITEYFEADRMVPAAGQGALGVETREDDLEIKTLLDVISDSRSETEVFAERVVLQELGGGCQVPIGVNAQLKDDRLHLIATVCSPDGKYRLLERLSSDSACAQELAVNLATKLIQNGAHKLENET
ncbi:hydroxymethylbilane synthase [Candidatus Poribacteria bacterium]|nr:hydroxymethylbilane synthase [Candidatus Poribacteria bacterium]